jgi:aminopeptidase
MGASTSGGSVSFTPSQLHLERYADVLVNYALGEGTGIAAGDVVHVVAPESAKPLYVEVCRAVWRSGGHVIGQYLPDDDREHNLSRDFYTLAGESQLTFLPKRYRRGLLDDTDHMVYIRAEKDPRALGEVDPAKLLTHRRSLRPVLEWRMAKENAGQFHWTAASYATEGMAQEAGMPLEEYWEQIVQACFLDQPDPKASWRHVAEQIGRYTTWLTGLPIDRLHVEGADVDLWITLGERRRWIGGGGRNIPSFEVFTSPDWRGTEGRIRFSEPLYIYGSLITGIELEFSEGRVRSARADQNQHLLEEMVATENADRVGEFSLTDARLSRITRFMADTLYDENVGGPYGNTHLALGRSLDICFDGDPATLWPDEAARLGFNDSATHTDIVSTTDRMVTALMRDGSEQVIYRGGQFTLED